MISKLENYRYNLSLIGITIDEVLLLNLYQNLPTNVQTRAKVILLPIAAKEGVVYAMDNITGDLVPFSFSRASSATLFDKDKNMELVGNNIPRIDYGNYTEGVKLLVEKESTNLLVDSALATSLNGVYNTGLGVATLNWFNYIVTGRTVPHLDGTDAYIYKRGPVTSGLSYAISAFVKMSDGTIPNFNSSESTRNGALLIDALPMYPTAANLLIKDNIYRVYGSKAATRTITGNNGIVKYRGNYGADIITSGYQLESGDTVTSYIPTTTTTATRAADLLTYTLPASSGIYLKTTKQNTLLNKPKGVWNIHDDLNNDGIEALAIFYEDIIIGFDEETAVEEFIIPIRDKNQVVKARYALKDTDIEKNTLMGEHYIEISFALDIFFRFVRSDYIIWEGEKYIIKEDYTPDEVNKCNYKYTLRFDHWTTLLQDDTFYYMNQNLEEAEWSLMSNAATHFQLLADNANRYFGVNTFNVGTIEFTELKYIRFDKVSIWDAATQIAEEYGGEWYLTGTTFHLVKKFSYGSEIDFESEVSVEKMERSEGENSEKYTRILAFGSTRNIPANYRETTPGEAVDAIYQKRLRIPASKGKFIDIRPILSPEEIKSAVVIFDEVYPKRIGTIGAVGTIPYQDTDTDTGVVTNWNAYKFKDTGIVFSEDYLLPGVELMLVFQSGNLNGMDFAVKFHKNGFSESDNSQYFEIVRNEDYGKPLPNDTLKPQSGDTYILYGFNIQLVSDQYIPAGEQELYDTAVEWQQDMLKDKSVFECPTMIQHFADNEMDLEIGQKVKLIHDQFEDGFRSSRIQGYEKHLLNKYQATYTVGDNATASWAKSVDNSIKELQIAGITYQATGKNGVYLITQFDNTPASDFNAYSAKASDARYLNKQTGGTVQGDVLFQKKIKANEAISDQFGNETFMPGMLGNGFRFWIENGLSFGQIDYLTVTREMLISVLTVAEVKSVDGGILISAANMICNKTEETTSGYKCYFDNDDGNIPNKFVVGDQAMCRRFNGANVKYYWRLVTEVGTDYILLSKTDKDGSGIPEAKDNIVQFGNRTDTQRQFAIYSVAYGDAGTFYYYGVNSYDLTGKAKTYFSKSGARIEGDSIVFSSSGKTAATAISEVDTKAGNAQTSANTANAGLLSKVAYSEYNAQMQILDTRISSKVSQTDFNTLDGRVASTESSITQQAGQISSVVQKVDNIKIGGVNKFGNTDFLSSANRSFTPPSIAWLNENRGKQMALSLYINTENAILSGNKRIGAELNVVFSDGSNGYFGVWMAFPDTSTTYKGRISRTFTFPDKQVVSIGYCQTFFQTFVSGTANAGYPQLEEGNIASDYKQSNEDIKTGINTAQTTADSKTRTYYQDAQPTAPSGGFSVGDIWQKVTYTDTSGVVNMDSSKNVCRFEYRWNGTTWVQINFNVSGSYVTQTNDSISSLVTKTGINSLGAGETLKSLIDQTPDKITLAVSAIQIGGRNLKRNSKILTGLFRTIGQVVNATPNAEWMRFSIVDFTGEILQSGSVSVQPGVEYTQSVLFRTDATSVDLNFSWWNATNGHRLRQAIIEKIGTNLYRAYSTFKTVTNDTTIRCLDIYPISKSGGTYIEFAYHKFELGNKPTDWTEAPEDTQSQIDGKTTLSEVASSLSIAANKITLSSKTIELKGDTIADAIEAGQLNVGNGKFKVDPNGDFTSKNANIEGALRVSGNNQITVADAGGNTRVTIKPTDITSIANIGGYETTEPVNTGGAAASRSIQNETNVWYGRTFTLAAGKVYDLVIPAISISATINTIGSPTTVYARTVIRLRNTTTYVSYEIASIEASPREFGGTVFQSVRLNGVVAGNWRIEIEMMAITDAYFTGTASFTMNSNVVIQVIPLSQFTEMGLNGFLTAMSSNKYMHITTDGIYMRMDQYMLRLTSSGLQKSTNGGASWISI
nr:MAG TPA_asm: tail protein [Caudoviricetes sp.]